MRLCTSALFLALAQVPFAHAQPATKPDHAVVLAYDRLFAKTSDERGGQLLLGELNCTSCHRNYTASVIPPRQAPILDGIGGRVRATYLKAFLENPQAAKPGTVMPNVLAALSEQEREDSTDALVHFLASTGVLIDVPPTPKSIAKGKKLFHEIGCAACHGPQGAPLKDDATVLPLGDLSKKYTVISLTNFLNDPHRTRPSGRMPSLNLNSSESIDIAHYLLANLAGAEGGANMTYSYYEFAKQPAKLPDFAKLKPTATGPSIGFDLNNARRTDNVALKFDGFLLIEAEGKYTFHVLSDDGSRLWINKELVVDNDGIHSPETKSGSVRLAKGVVPVTVAAFNGGGGFELEITVDGPGIRRQPLSRLVVPGAGASPAKAQSRPREAFQVNEERAKKGRALFATLGCASCHSLKDGANPIASKLSAPDLDKLNPSAGCLADAPGKSAPRYALNASQRAALVKALQNSHGKTQSPKEVIAHTFAAFNCYACHQRDGIGGVEAGLNDFFVTTQKEMGDEARVPPHLNGVGSKLTTAYLKKVLANAATDRPYMLTRMPKFGQPVVHLQAALETVDPALVAPVPTFKVDEKKVKSEGRAMVGNRIFGCIKCHNFREFKSGGVQGINMTVMAERVRREWFVQYLLDPNKYRPGTRMPAVWPLGQSQLPKVLEGDPLQQIEAVWLYLSDGPKAALPYGLGKEPLPLIAQDTALIYRNFITGAGARAIGVGYPEKVNLAFDANDLRYALLWHKEFIDASKHWTGRGEGFQGPLGEDIVSLPSGPSIALLPSKDDAWPAKAVKDKGYQFRGYRLDDKLRPTFLYDLGDVHVEDTMVPVVGKDDEHFKRVVSIATATPHENLWFRAAAGADIKDLGNGWYSAGKDLKTRLETPAPAVMRTRAGLAELLVPIQGKQTRIVQELVW